MKYPLIFSGILFSTLSLFIVQACDHKNEPSSNTYASEFPLIYHMAFLDRFTNKLYFAGQNENWELADWYAHEVEDVSEMIIDGGYIKYGTDIGHLMESMLLPQIDQVEEAIDTRDPNLFMQSYQTLIQTCNQCHIATKYPFIQVTVPETNPHNQDFSPQVQE